MFDKPSNWGTRYQFPENAKLESDGYVTRLVENISVQMADQYEALVVDTIAREARAAGASDVTVLNKRVILDALTKRTPRGAARYRTSRCCPNCREELTGRGLFCSTCGQAIDPKQEEAEIPRAATPYTATEAFREQDKYRRNAAQLTRAITDFILRANAASALPDDTRLRALDQLARDTSRELQQIIYAEDRTWRVKKEGI